MGESNVSEIGRKIIKMYSVREMLLQIRNPQTKQKYLELLKKWDAMDSSIGLVYRWDSFVKVNIY